MIILRAATTDDAAAILSIYAPYVVTNAVSFETTPPLAKDMRARIKAYEASSAFRHQMNAQPRVEIDRIDQVPD